MKEQRVCNFFGPRWSSCDFRAGIRAPRGGALEHGRVGYHQRLVKEFDWQNPHPLLLLDVKSDKGAVETWAVEFHRRTLWPGALGWTHNTFKPGSRSRFMDIRRKKDSPS